ncbi:MAG: DNA-binding protein [Lentimicrobiaceae bacterium]|nr:DNA-binding protein [Lentimicrobiaceae bacterium]MBE6347079.1 DNA-binding protein [Lentimicrobiaceae bacterium]
MKVLLLISFFIVAIVWIYIGVNRAKIIGNIGERKISLRLHLLPTEYYLLDDVYLKVNENYVQIDHIVVSKYGIFVIETKNMKGWIFGTDKSEYWTKNMYGKKYSFRNPLKQNYYHVKTLQTLLNIPQNKFVPIVVFMKGASLKCKTDGIVTTYRKLIRVVRNYKEIVFDDNEVQRIIYVLTESSIKDRKHKKEHVNKVKQTIAVRDVKIKSGICPRCNGKLVERDGEYGRFLGCSNYPNCKFTKSL